MTHINCKIIGITGGIATGKSTFTEVLKDMGYKVVDADNIAKDLMKQGNLSYKKTVEYFGEEILRDDGEVDRKALGERVFSDPELLKALNGITHPDIFEEIKRQINDNGDKIIFLDIPLLFEEHDEISSCGIYFDEIWLIYADRDTQINRVMKRDSLTKEGAVKRVDSQLSIGYKKENSTKVIYNLESIDKLRSKIELLLRNLS